MNFFFFFFYSLESISTFQCGHTKRAAVFLFNRLNETRYCILVCWIFAILTGLVIYLRQKLFLAAFVRFLIAHIWRSCLETTLFLSLIKLTLRALKSRFTVCICYIQHVRHDLDLDSSIFSLTIHQLPKRKNFCN